MVQRPSIDAYPMTGVLVDQTRHALDENESCVQENLKNSNFMSTSIVPNCLEQNLHFYE